MKRELSVRKKWLLVLLSGAIVLALLSVARLVLTSSPGLVGQFAVSGILQPEVASHNDAGGSTNLFNGSVPSLTWIVGRDCRRGISAYLSTAATNPDAALVGTGWVDPTNGQLIDGENNNCVAGSLSMDSVVELIHQHKGKAYLTIAMETDGTSDSWTTAQQTAYVVKATKTPGYIQSIVDEAQRANYDGVIMDLEGTDDFYPGISQIFATYNQQVWHALQPLHKLYGIALIHKLSDHDDYYHLNGFEDWRLLGKSADFLVVMAVDQSYWTPGPSVGVPWLKQLLDYTLETVPQMLPHIIWELPLYGNSWRRSSGDWIFEGIISYQDAVNRVDKVSRSQIDLANSDLSDAYAPHLTYTDDAGTTRSLWYMNGQSLHNIMRDFWQLLREQPQFANGPLQFATWWSTTSQPPDFWQKANSLY